MRLRLAPLRLKGAFCWWFLVAAALPGQSPRQPGKLAISSVPKGASICVNGNKMGQATDATFVVSAGNYRVSASGGAGNLNCTSKSVTVSAGELADLNCTAAGRGAKTK